MSPFRRYPWAEWGVLLLAHGAPDKLDDIPEFLLNVRGGRPLPDPVVKEITHRYSLIGGGSPLLRITTLQAEALAKLVAHPVYVGMRNWKPFIPDAVRRLCRRWCCSAWWLCAWRRKIPAPVLDSIENT